MGLTTLVGQQVVYTNEYYFWSEFFNDDRELLNMYQQRVWKSTDGFIDWDFALIKYYWFYYFLYHLIGSATPHLSQGKQYRAMLRCIRNRINFITFTFVESLSISKKTNLEYRTRLIIHDRVEKMRLYRDYGNDKGHREVLKLWKSILLDIQRGSMMKLLLFRIKPLLLKLIFLYVFYIFCPWTLVGEYFDSISSSTKVYHYLEYFSLEKIYSCFEELRNMIFLKMNNFYVLISNVVGFKVIFLVFICSCIIYSSFGYETIPKKISIGTESSINLKSIIIFCLLCSVLYYFVEIWPSFGTSAVTAIGNIGYRQVKTISSMIIIYVSNWSHVIFYVCIIYAISLFYLNIPKKKSNCKSYNYKYNYRKKSTSKVDIFIFSCIFVFLLHCARNYFDVFAYFPSKTVVKCHVETITFQLFFAVDWYHFIFYLCIVILAIVFIYSCLPRRTSRYRKKSSSVIWKTISIFCVLYLVFHYLSRFFSSTKEMGDHVHALSPYVPSINNWSDIIFYACIMCLPVIYFKRPSKRRYNKRYGRVKSTIDDLKSMISVFIIFCFILYCFKEDIGLLDFIR